MVSLPFCFLIEEKDDESVKWEERQAFSFARDLFMSVQRFFLEKCNCAEEDQSAKFHHPSSFIIRLWI